MELVTKSFDFTLKKRKWVILLALFGFSSYGMYKVYNSSSVSRNRKRFMNFFGALISIAETVSDSANTLTIVSNDLKEFLASDSDKIQIPNSLNQLSKLLVSNEFSNSLSRVFESATIGVIHGYNEEEQKTESSNFNNNNKILDKLTSKAGSGFVSVIVGSFARNLVLGFYPEDDNGLKKSNWVDLLNTEKSKSVMADLINKFVSTAVAVYLDRGSSMNVYDSIFSGLTESKHQKQVKDIVVYVCSGAVETFVRTSHQVLKSSHQESAFNTMMPI